MDLKLSGKTALVTGASSVGIGRVIAMGLAEEGVRVAITSRRAHLLEEVAQQIRSRNHPDPVVLPVDLYEPGAPEQLARAAHERLGRIDILVNAAGGSRPTTLDAPTELWEEAMLLNFMRLRELTHAVVKVMIENRWGRIVSLTGSSEPYNINAANPSKAAVHAWSKGLSREVAKYGVTVNCIQPGRISSEQMLRMYPTEEKRRAFTQEVPIARFGEPQELGDLAVFLCSPRASYITGTVIPVDGGLSRFAF
ncbi:MAG TPA: SDR family oxidoreductase [Burkholderiales bacterium]|nr:SDR family oxidoreductase [Burkholderiales bacterium]